LRTTNAPGLSGSAYFFLIKGKNMKKILALALSLASIGFTASAAEAKSVEASLSPEVTVASNAPAPQWENRRRRNRWNNRRVQVYTTTRLVRYGRAIFRETYQVRRLPNGRTQTRLISRVRVR
jgi:hypothetical protein